MEKYIIEYNECLNNILSYIDSQKKELASLRNRYNSIQNSKADQVKLQSIQKSILRLLYSITDSQEEVLFLRPKLAEDISYRNGILNGNYAQKIKDLDIDDLHLCFHGTPIHRAKAIIESGIISSSADRIGYSTSPNNPKGQISIATHDIFSIVYSYMEMNFFDLPAGCIFAILPKNELEVESSKTISCIGNINFKEEPHRLFAIITTPENIDRVKEWCQNYQIDEDKIFDFYSFISMLENKFGYKNHSKKTYHSN